MEYSAIALIVVITIVVTLVIREFVMWYWKINRIVKGLDDIYELLLLLSGKEMEEKTVTIVNKNTKKEKTITVKKFLKMPNKVNFKMKIQNQTL